jgi:hypothetical protein
MSATRGRTTLLQKRVSEEGVFVFVGNGENVIPSLRGRKGDSVFVENGNFVLWRGGVRAGRNGWIDGWKKMDQTGELDRIERTNRPRGVALDECFIVVGNAAILYINLPYLLKRVQNWSL